MEISISGHVKNRQTIHVSFDSIVFARLQELQKEMGMTASNVLRSSINALYDKEQRKKFGYKGNLVAVRQITKDVKKEAYDENAAALEAMTDDDLNTFLAKNGYFHDEYAPKDRGEMVDLYRVDTWEGHRGLYRVTCDKFDDSKVTYRAFRLAWPQFIEDLKKEKIL